MEDLIMKQKKISLRTGMFLESASSVLLVLLYWMNVRTGSLPVHILLTALAFIFFGVYVYYDKKKDLFDESARENLRRTDSLCLRTAYAFGILSIIAIIVSDNLLAGFEVTGVTIGYSIVSLIFFFTVLRAAIFSIIDKRGI